MMIDEIKKLIQNGEKIDVEFKESQNALTKDVFDIVCSFNNRIAETLDLVSNLAHAIFHGDISVPELAKILGKGIIEPYQYLGKHISVLKPSNRFVLFA